jgi:hypothetical protein
MRKNKKDQKGGKMMEALTPKGFAQLSDEEMFAVDGGGAITDVFSGIIAVLETATVLGVGAFSAVLNGLMTFASFLVELFV